MTYYEEFALSKSCSTEEVRHTYRNLTRLLHPDQYQDAKLRALAECQMKRLNEIFAILLDSDKRRRYNQELEAGTGRLSNSASATLAIVRFRPAFPSLFPDWSVIVNNWVWVLIVAIGLGSVLWYFSRGDTDRKVIARSESAAVSVRPAAADMPVGQQPTHERRTSPEPKRDMEVRMITDLRRKLGIAQGERDAARAQVAAYRAREAVARSEPSSLVVAERRKPEPSPPPLTAPPETPPIVKQPPAAITPAAVAEKPIVSGAAGFGGTWFYAPDITAPPSESLYPPEYIELIITERTGSIWGRYRGRYRVSDKAIPQVVAFQFHGPASSTSAHFQWQGSAGSKGEVRLRLLSPDSMEMNWWVTELGTWTGLVSGTAILTRRKEL